MRYARKDDSEGFVRYAETGAASVMAVPGVLRNGETRGETIAQSNERLLGLIEKKNEKKKEYTTRSQENEAGGLTEDEDGNEADGSVYHGPETYDSMEKGKGGLGQACDRDGHEQQKVKNDPPSFRSTEAGVSGRRFVGLKRLLESTNLKLWVSFTPLAQPRAWRERERRSREALRRIKMREAYGTVRDPATIISSPRLWSR